MDENSESTKHPPLNEVMALICSLDIRKLRVPHPDHNLLKALLNTNVEVNLGIPNEIPNEDLLNLALSYVDALRWVDNYIKPYSSSLKIRYISVGNEVFKGEERLWYLVLPAMQNVHKALHSLDKDGYFIGVSTSVGMDVLCKWTNHLHARFLDDWTPFIVPILKFLFKNKLPLMVKVFPYIMNKKTSCLEWIQALDEAVKAFHGVIERIGYHNVPIVVSSSGLPSAGGEPNVATRANTLAYSQWLVGRQPYLLTLLNSKRYPGDKLEWASLISTCALSTVKASSLERNTAMSSLAVIFVFCASCEPFEYWLSTWPFVLFVYLVPHMMRQPSATDV